MKYAAAKGVEQILIAQILASKYQLLNRINSICPISAYYDHFKQWHLLYLESVTNT
jgi:hypothetical protein